MHKLSLTAPSEDAQLTAFLDDRYLRRSLYLSVSLRARSGRTWQRRELDTELQSDLDVAIHFGFVRAKMERFLAALGHEAESWFVERRIAPESGAHNCRDRRWDYYYLIAEYPEFRDYVTDCPIRRSEILPAARKEIRALLEGVGSDAQEWRNTRTRDSGGTETHTFVVGDIADTLPCTTTWTSAALWDTSPNSLSSVALETARILVPYYGLVPTLYWVWAKFVVEEVVEVVRLFGPEGWEQEDPISFDTCHRDVRRKIASIDKEFPRLAESRTLQLSHDMLCMEVAA